MNAGKLLQNEFRCFRTIYSKLALNGAHTNEAASFFLETAS